MGKTYFTITGTCYRYGSDFIEPDMLVSLIKEPDKEADPTTIINRCNLEEYKLSIE